MADEINREELEKIAEKIRKKVIEKIESELKKNGGSAMVPPIPDAVLKNAANNAVSEKNTEGSAVSIDVDSLTAEDKIVSTADDKFRGSADDDFWDFGKPKPRTYEKPEFSPEALSLSPVEENKNAEGILKNSSDEISAPAHTAEKIPPREEFVSRHVNDSRHGNDLHQPRTVNTVDGPRVVTGSYKRPRPRTYTKPVQLPPRERHEDVTYEPGGALIHKIIIKDWVSDSDFYSRFAADARQSHSAEPKIPYSQPMKPVQFFSYVPQYAHMTSSQLEYYRWVRENIRHGSYPDCDMPYLMLYIYEILNLDGTIQPKDGAEALVSVWRGYRARWSRLDGYLCEWLADYCMIHCLPMPDSLLPILREIVPKAQLKEFYLDKSMSGENGRMNLEAAAKALIDNSSDYDYKTSRYYPENREAYEKYIPQAVTKVIEDEFEKKRGIFAMDRTYHMVRDSYVGAVVSSGSKKRLDIEFSSFTRRAGSREHVTSIVKYTENKLRQTLGIKAKLGVGSPDPEDISVIDEFFAPMMPQKKNVRANAEDKYMPEDYLKNYEADSTGFDISAAAEIERLSWENTDRLTGANPAEEAAAGEEYQEQAESIAGELSTDSIEKYENYTEAETLPEENAEEIIPIEAAPDECDNNINNNEENSSGKADDIIKGAVQAALEGNFRAYARERGLYEGELADRVNSIFLEVIGDVILEDFKLIEDYREDAEEWMK